MLYSVILNLCMKMYMFEMRSVTVEGCKIPCLDLSIYEYYHKNQFIVYIAPLNV